MSYDFSQFGRHLGEGSGIEELMEDLGQALANAGPDTKMLGGGQPARIPEINAVWKRRIEEIIEQHGGLEKAMTAYDPPRGNPAFLEAIAALFRNTFGWDIGPENVAVTAVHDEALRLEQQAVQLRRRVLGALHPDTALASLAGKVTSQRPLSPAA